MQFYNNKNSFERNIEGKFYPLTDEILVKACKELTATQRDVFFYIKTLDPDGEGLDFGVKELAEQLELSKRTVSRALVALDRLGWLDLKKIFSAKS